MTMREKTGIQLSDLEEGMSLPALTRKITQEKINLYAEASGDFNPIHIDPEFAGKTPLGGTIAHGMLILAYVSHMMTLNFGKPWLTDGKLSVRFKSPARPGDTVTVNSTVRKLTETENGRVLVKCEVVVQNQDSETIIIADASVRIPRQ